MSNNLTPDYNNIMTRETHRPTQTAIH